MLPRIRAAYAKLYPDGAQINKQIHPKIDGEQDFNQTYLRADENEEQQQLFRSWTNELLLNPSKEQVVHLLERYRDLWNSRRYGARFFDLHGREFQNFAVTLTNLMEQPEWRRLSVSRNHADRRILRSRVYAIASRDDVGWDGKFIEDAKEREEKQKAMIQHLQSLELFDWLAPSCEYEARGTGPIHTIEISIKRQGTQETVQELYSSMGNDRELIAWLNFAASHNVCGSYSVNFGGSQEEEVATNCDGAVLLGTLGHFVETGLKSWMRGRWVSYNTGMHIPPGGNYWALTKFVTGPFHVDCAMIATAFTDLRPYMPVFCPYTERPYFYSFFGYLKSQKELEQRFLIDIEGVLKTCLAKGVHTLVTGATGCGAFRHDPYIEAKLWKQCLERDEFRCGSLRQVVFSILDRENSDNWIAFQKAFGEAGKGSENARESTGP